MRRIEKRKNKEVKKESLCKKSRTCKNGRREKRYGQIDWKEKKRKTKIKMEHS